jgi:hypothetical protein
VAPEGWYADPVGRPQYRFWSGVQWTEYTHPYPLARSAESAMRRVRDRQPRLTVGTRVNSVWVWLIVGLFVLSFAVIYGFALGFGRVLERGLSGSQGVALSFYTDPAYWILIGITWVILAATVVCAWRDTRYLSSIGLLRPFHWAFAFLGPLVYMIGRSIVAGRAVAGSYRPLWALSVAMVLSASALISLITIQTIEVLNLVFDYTTRV